MAGSSCCTKASSLEVPFVEGAQAQSALWLRKLPRRALVQTLRTLKTSKWSSRDDDPLTVVALVSGPLHSKFVSASLVAPGTLVEEKQAA